MPSSASNPLVVNPLAVPMPGNPIAERLNRELVRRAVHKHMQRLGVQSPILWLSVPTAVRMSGLFGERALVYYCGDDFGSMKDVDDSVVGPAEQELVEQADLVLAASAALAETFPERKTHLVPHGVDYELFTKAVPPPGDLPRGAPVVGFYGSIADWLDLDLLDGVFRALPSYEFVFIGPQRVSTERLASHANVTILGERPHEALPSYSQNWDVSILPFKDNPQIRACNPLKLREYLAAGRPIVSTDFSSLDGYRDLVEVAGTVNEFASAIVESRNSHNSDRAAERRARVEPESWNARATQVDELLRQV
jgi:glycosyltransferase involved in cell wall biosynthesis